MLFVSVGSETNDDDDPEPRASILAMRPDGSGARLFARGLRNPVGLALHPQTHALWAAVEERDRLGDDLVPDYVTEVREGGFYGWPFAYLGPHEDPRHQGERPDLVAHSVAPDVLIQAHSAVLGLVFYEGAMFPSEYSGDAFVALHGSWNRSKRTGYKIVRIRFQGERPRGGYDDFVTGWMLDELSRDVWGRPVGLLVAKDGALLVADDGANLVWRVSHSAR
jgi:glucose/arabinose dehydrogenase